MARPAAALTVTTGDSGELIAHFSGVLDFGSVPGLEPEIVALVAQQTTAVTIDLAQLDFADSTGIAVLLRLVGRFGSLPVHGASATVRRVITGLGLHHVLLLAPDEPHEAQWTGHFEARPVSVWAAREFVLDHWPDGDPEVRDAVVLMVSELSSNAVRHAASDFDVTVSFPAPGEVRIGVSDRDSGRPTPCAPSLNDLHGRGLQIVELLSDAWGVEPASDGPGKTVWFTLHDDSVGARVSAG
jgi:anti-anti-sigma factor